MATLDEVLAKVEEGNSVDSSLIALLEGIKKQLDDALAGTTLPPAVQEKVNQIFDGLVADNEKVSAALLANTPETPTDPSADPVV